MTSLSKVDCPDVLTHWINGERKSWPVIKGLPGFVLCWKKWWGSLQPATRLQPGKSTLTRTVNADEGWDELKKGSINGIFNIVISLAWWHQALKTPAQHKAFLEMVDDVSWVLDQMILLIGKGKKRGQGNMAPLDGLQVKR